MPAPLADDAVLAGLVEQFASPYDFLRELVQNSLDAGASRVDVELHVHPGDDPAGAVFEIAARDDGCGMGEEVIDGQLARLFVSGKRNDRTMAGGFGVGFVSVFAWRPDQVLLQTGRHGEAWELDFDGRGRFSKQPVAETVEGTVVRLFRRDRAAARSKIAAEIRDTLWRWCRFCRLQIEFTDVGVAAPEIIRDTIELASAAVAVEHQAGDTSVRVAFGARGHVVMLRNALVLAQGRPDVLLPRVLVDNAESGEHLDVWADSAAWRTDIGRDHVVDDAGRRTVEGRIVDMIGRCRRALVDRLAELVADPEVASRHGEYARLHAHLRLERRALGDLALDRALLRTPAGPMSMGKLLDRAAWRVVATVDPGAPAPDEVSEIPTVVADANDRDGWLGPWLEEHGIAVAPWSALVHRVTPLPHEARDLVASVADLVRRTGAAKAIGLAELDGPVTRPFAAQFGDDATRAVAPPGRSPVRRPILWIDARHPLWKAAIEASAKQPLVAAGAIAFAIGRLLGTKPVAIARALDEQREAEARR